MDGYEYGAIQARAIMVLGEHYSEALRFAKMIGDEEGIRKAEADLDAFRKKVNRALRQDVEEPEERRDDDIDMRIIWYTVLAFVAVVFFAGMCHYYS